MHTNKRSVSVELWAHRNHMEKRWHKLHGKQQWNGREERRVSRADRFEFTLDEETEKRLYDLLTDMDTRKTDRFWIQDKRGYHAEYVKVIRCKECKFHTNGMCLINYARNGMYIHCGNEEFCCWAERKEE